MRVRVSAFAAAAALLVLPALGEAQRIPMPRRPGPASPLPMPDMPGSIAREYAYRRLPFAVESYPMLSYFSATGAPPGYAPSWSVGGVGTRLDYRLTPFVSATLDVTQSFIGSPSYTQTAELGTRFRPERTVVLNRRWFPYFDIRVGYQSSLQNASGAVIVDPFSGGAPVGPGSRYSAGFGVAAGTGMEFALSRMMSVVAGGSVMQSRMTTTAFTTDERATYSLRSVRFIAALRFSPVRAMTTASDVYSQPAPRP